MLDENRMFTSLYTPLLDHAIEEKANAKLDLAISRRI